MNVCYYFDISLKVFKVQLNHIAAVEWGDQEVALQKKGGGRALT